MLKLSSVLELLRTNVIGLTKMFFLKIPINNLLSVRIKHFKTIKRL
jgi:hypothetical protein